MADVFFVVEHSTVFRLDTSHVQLDSCPVRLDSTQCRLATSGEYMDSSAAVVSAGHRQRLRPGADAHSDGTAGGDGLRGQTSQPAAAGEVRCRHAESDSRTGR